MVVEEFVDVCRGAVDEGEPMLAVKACWRRRLRTGQRLTRSGTAAPGLHVLHRDATVAIFNLVLSPGTSYCRTTIVCGRSWASLPGTNTTCSTDAPTTRSPSLAD